MPIPDRVLEVVEHALWVTCPNCGMRAGNSCMWDDGEKSRGILIHYQRIALAHSTREIIIPSEQELLDQYNEAFPKLTEWTKTQEDKTSSDE